MAPWESYHSRRSQQRRGVHVAPVKKSNKCELNAEEHDRCAPDQQDCGAPVAPSVYRAWLAKATPGPCVGCLGERLQCSAVGSPGIQHHSITVRSASGPVPVYPP
nr:hypothetical protein CFP56_12902 [Quercus suber]